MGIFFRFFSLLFLLTSCSVADNDSSIHKYEYSEINDMKINYLDVFVQPEDCYYIYYYQENCYHCHGIKSKVIHFALSAQYSFYFVEVKEDYGFLSRTKEDTIGTNDPMQAFALMTPQLSLVVDWRIKETYVGDEEILNVIE